MAQVDPAHFKHAFGNHPAGVALITATGPEGPVGLTASSVASVSLTPPSLVFSVTNNKRSGTVILAADSYVVHLLSAADVEVAKAFAKPNADRFTPEQGFTFLPGGEPYLPGVHAALRCHDLSQVETGDSTVVVAEIDEILVDEPGSRLVYVDRQFHALSEDTRLS